VLTTKAGHELRPHCIPQRTDHQNIMREHLGRNSPKTLCPIPMNADSPLRHQSLTEIHGDAGLKRKLGTRSELAKVVSKEAAVESAQNAKDVRGSFCSVDFLYPSQFYAKRAAPLHCVDRRQPAYIDTFAHSRVHFRGLGVRRSERSRPTSVV
jgi:hypothetical protein